MTIVVANPAYSPTRLGAEMPVIIEALAGKFARGFDWNGLDDAAVEHGMEQRRRRS